MRYYATIACLFLIAFGLYTAIIWLDNATIDSIRAFQSDTEKCFCHKTYIFDGIRNDTNNVPIVYLLDRKTRKSQKITAGFGMDAKFKTIPMGSLIKFYPVKLSDADIKSMIQNGWSDPSILMLLDPIVVQ